jgi:CheY-like chemotaxis protein
MENLTVLVVDDDYDCRLALRLILERRGVLVIEASGGAEAAEVARRECPQLIFMDLLMPEVDGRLAARMIREAEGECDKSVIIAYSALADPRMRAESMEGGFFDRYIDKGLLYNELDGLLRHFRPTW